MSVQLFNLKPKESLKQEEVNFYLIERAAEIKTQLCKDILKMGLQKNVFENINIEFQSGLKMNPNIYLKKKKIHLQLPILLLIKKEDIEFNSPLFKQFSNLLKNKILNDKEINLVHAFFDYLQDSKDQNEPKILFFYMN